MQILSLALPQPIIYERLVQPLKENHFGLYKHKQYTVLSGSVSMATNMAAFEPHDRNHELLIFNASHAELMSLVRSERWQSGHLASSLK